MPPAPRMLIVPALEDGQFGAYQGALRRCELTSPEVSHDHIIDRINVRRENLITWVEAWFLENALAGYTIEYLALIQDDGVDLSMLPNRRLNLLESGAGHNRKACARG